MVPNQQSTLPIQSHFGSWGNVPASHLSSDHHLHTRELAIRQTALEARPAGISVVPILPDGTKRPAVRWRVYQQRIASSGKIARWFGGEARDPAFGTVAIGGGVESPA